MIGTSTNSNGGAICDDLETEVAGRWALGGVLRLIRCLGSVSKLRFIATGYETAWRLLHKKTSPQKSSKARCGASSGFFTAAF